MTDIQKVILTIFNEVSKICKSNDIPYYAIGGTCIGAIRHKGFIPWDDDLDIAIPIEYYDKFLNCAKEQLPKDYYVLSPSDAKHIHSLWTKVCDRRTTFIEETEYAYPDSYKGVFVDIMPISGLPETKICRKTFCSLLKFLDRSNNILRFCKDAPLKKRYSMYLPFLILSYILPFDFFSKLFYKIIRQRPFFKSSYTGYVWYTCWLKRLIFPTGWFKVNVEMPFEDTVISCPKNYHEYLTFQFGDYMTPPPVEKRMTHNGLVDIQKPYQEYFGKWR